jgi:polyisoprenyl-phosphate glycosyltransferase
MGKRTKKVISIVTPCFNEEANVEILYAEVKKVFAEKPDMEYEHIFIDNDSRDKTPQILRSLAGKDPRVKVILNARNFGQIRSPMYGILQSSGDAVILMVADLQDPPAMIKEFVQKWQEGFKIVVGIKEQSEESPVMFALRKMYYNLINRLSDIELLKNFTGFGLYDKQIIEVLKTIDDPYPYFRGLISDIGFEKCKIPYVQPARKRGLTKNNLYTLYDIAMLGITSHSKIPLRLATLMGFAASFLSLLVAFAYFVYKLIFWNSFSIGIAPMVVGLFFFSSVQLFFIGIIGEYLGTIYTQVLKRPLVVEKERINF